MRIDVDKVFGRHERDKDPIPVKQMVRVTYPACRTIYHDHLASQTVRINNPAKPEFMFSHGSTIKDQSKIIVEDINGQIHVVSRDIVSNV